MLMYGKIKKKNQQRQKQQQQQKVLFYSVISHYMIYKLWIKRIINKMSLHKYFSYTYEFVTF